jgi:hypothetical protein
MRSVFFTSTYHIEQSVMTVAYARIGFVARPAWCNAIFVTVVLHSFDPTTPSITGFGAVLAICATATSHRPAPSVAVGDDASITAISSHDNIFISAIVFGSASKCDATAILYLQGFRFYASLLFCI